MSKMVMVNGYYNGVPYAQKHNATNIYSSAQPWTWGPNYQNHQFLSDIDAHHHQMYYNSHPHILHPSPPSEWHSPATATATATSSSSTAVAAAAAAADNFSANAPSAHQMLHSHHHHLSHGGGSGGGGGGGGGNSVGPGNINNSSHNSSVSSAGSNSTPVGPTSANLNDNGSGNNHIREQHNINNIGEGISSPPITVSGSEISSPGVTATSSPPHSIPHHVHHNNNNSHSGANDNIIAHNSNSSNHGNNRESPVKAQYYDWMKKPSYPAQPTPGKTRTKDKYRVVYTDYQRLELEKEYCTSRYITIRRKTELAANLGLSERQVKIWFQNRRAKERKQNKKVGDGSVIGGVVQHSDYANIMETKPKLEPGLHLQHSLHSMSSLQAMGITPSAMGLHHLHHGHHPLSVSAAAHSHHHMNQSQHSVQMSAAAAVASVSSMSM